MACYAIQSIHIYHTLQVPTSSYRLNDILLSSQRPSDYITNKLINPYHVKWLFIPAAATGPMWR